MLCLEYSPQLKNATVGFEKLTNLENEAKRDSKCDSFELQIFFEISHKKCNKMQIKWSWDFAEKAKLIETLEAPESLEWWIQFCKILKALNHNKFFSVVKF